MPYTLMMGLLWVLLAVVLGIVVGWLLRSVAARRQVERARSGAGDADTQAELERLRARVADLEAAAADHDHAAPAPWPPSPPDVGAATGGFAAGPDERADVDVPGSPVEFDDLEAIVGIGPEIADLCQGIGITTWAELSVTEVSLLRTMLADAGPGVATVDPSTWPRQAALLAAGDWAELREITDRLDGDRAGG